MTRAWGALAVLALTAACGYGGAYLEPTVVSIEPHVARSRATTQFTLRGHGFDRLGKTLRVVFRPTAAESGSEVEAEAYVASSTCIRGVFPGTPTRRSQPLLVTLEPRHGGFVYESDVVLTLLPRGEQGARARSPHRRKRLGDLSRWQESGQPVLEGGVEDADGTLWIRVRHPNGRLAVEGRRSANGFEETWTTWDEKGRRLGVERTGTE